MYFKVIRHEGRTKDGVEDYEAAINDTVQKLINENYNIQDVEHLEQITPDGKRIISTTYIKYLKVRKMGRPKKY